MTHVNNYMATNQKQKQNDELLAQKPYQKEMMM